MTWQDPVALALAAALMALSLWWRKRLLARGEAGCGGCDRPEAPGQPPRKTRVPLESLRLGRQNK
jgi:hypothetical protein